MTEKRVCKQDQGAESSTSDIESGKHGEVSKEEPTKLVQSANYSVRDDRLYAVPTKENKTETQESNSTRSAEESTRGGADDSIERFSMFLSPLEIWLDTWYGCIFWYFYRCAPPLGLVITTIIISIWDSDKRDVSESIGWYASIPLYIFIALGSFAGATRVRGRCYELLCELEDKMYHDSEIYMSTVKHMNTAYPGVIVGTMGTVATSSMKNLSVGKLEVDPEIGGQYGVGNGKGDTRAKFLKQVSRKITLTDFNYEEASAQIDVKKPRTPRMRPGSAMTADYSTSVGIPSFIAIIISIVSLVNLMLNCVYAPDHRWLAVSLVRFLSASFVYFGDFKFFLITTFRWLHVTLFSIECWSYSVIALIENYAHYGPSDETITEAFLARLDALHDIYGIPIAVLNQKIATPVIVVTIGGFLIIVQSIAFSYSNTKNSGLQNIVIGICVPVLSYLMIYSLGHVTEAFIQCRDSLRRPRVLAALHNLLGGPENAEMMIQHYLLSQEIGFKVGGAIFSHSFMNGLILTISIGILFAVGPALVNEAVGGLQ